MEKTGIKTEVKPTIKTDVKPTIKTEVKPMTPVTNAPQGNRPANPNDRGGPRRDNRGPRRPRRDNEPKEFEERTVAIKRVTKVVKGGKHMRFTALVVIGNGKGKYGFAHGKAGEVPDAIKKALEAARKNTSMIQFVRAATINHEVQGQWGATNVFLKPAPDGTGIIAGGPVRAILELAGCKNVYSKVYGSRAAINIVRATHDALSQLKSKKEYLALRGKL
jgi:small subunit ribosomal protein S5